MDRFLSIDILARTTLSITGVFCGAAAGKADAPVHCNQPRICVGSYVWGSSLMCMTGSQACTASVTEIIKDARSMRVHPGLVWISYSLE